MRGETVARRLKARWASSGLLLSVSEHRKLVGLICEDDILAAAADADRSEHSRDVAGGMSHSAATHAQNYLPNIGRSALLPFNARLEESEWKVAYRRGLGWHKLFGRYRQPTERAEESILVSGRELFARDVVGDFVLNRLAKRALRELPAAIFRLLQARFQSQQKAIATCLITRTPRVMEVYLGTGGGKSALATFTYAAFTKWRCGVDGAPWSARPRPSRVFTVVLTHLLSIQVCVRGCVYRSSCVPRARRVTGGSLGGVQEARL